MDPLVAYAAVVATASLAWQIYSWWHRRRSHVKVDVRRVVETPTKRLRYIAIAAINRSEHPVRVEAVGLDPEGPSINDHTWAFAPDSTLPGEVAPHDSGIAHVFPDDVARKVGADATVIGWVRLATGDLVKSPATRLRSRSQSEHQ